MTLTITIIVFPAYLLHLRKCRVKIHKHHLLRSLLLGLHSPLRNRLLNPLNLLRGRLLSQHNPLRSRYLNNLFSRIPGNPLL
jgi:hypothetical protein